LTRTYDLTGDSVDLERPTFWEEITLHGGKLVKQDAGFMFISSSLLQTHNSPQFVNTHFEGAVGIETIIFNGNHFIRQNMTKCYFDKISLVHSDEYIQSLRLINCETIRHQTDFIKADNGFDLKVIGHRGET